jgi:uncharacterized small protein (DUF1192 family)
MIAFCDCDRPLSDCRGWCKNCGDRLGEDERDKEISDLRTRIAELEAERDAAKAGAARAVEALKGVAEAGWLPDMEEVIHSVDCTCDFCDQNRLLEAIEQILSDDAQPALHWLYQRESEAIVRELNQLGPLGSSNQELFMVPWSEIKRRIAALTNHQPTACPRSEVRGEENNNA